MLLALVLLAAFVVARTCGSSQQKVSQDEAVDIAIDRAGFEPCAQKQCLQVRALRQGIPSRLYWVIGLARSIDADGEPTGTKSFLIDVNTGAATEQS